MSLAEVDEEQEWLAMDIKASPAGTNRFWRSDGAATTETKPEDPRIEGRCIDRSPKCPEQSSHTCPGDSSARLTASDSLSITRRRSPVRLRACLYPGL